MKETICAAIGAFGAFLAGLFGGAGTLQWQRCWSLWALTTPRGGRTLLDTVNYSSQIVAKLTSENLNNKATNGICELFYADANNTCKNAVVSGKAFF